MRRNEIWWANIPLIRYDTNIQNGARPVLIISNDTCNEKSPVVTIIPFTTKKASLIPTHVNVKSYESGLYKDSVALCEQVTSIDKKYLIFKLWDLPLHKVVQVDEALKVQQNLSV